MSQPLDPEDGDEWALGPDEGADWREPPETVVIIDSSSIVKIKTLVPTGQQWDLFARMLELVEEGRLAFPTQVHKEVARVRHPDAPGVWCGRAAQVVQHPDAEEDTLVEILPAIAQLVDENADLDTEPADPYVVAMAYELRAAGFDVVVATEDRVDRLPLKMALMTACDRLGLATWDTEALIRWAGA